MKLNVVEADKTGEINVPLLLCGYVKLARSLRSVSHCFPCGIGREGSSP